jgi:hypothetical protein
VEELRDSSDLVPLLLASILVGLIIGAFQCFFVFGIWGCGLIADCWLSSILIAFFEGGLTGAIIATPVGLVTWYAILGRKVTRGEVRMIVLGSLLGGCVLAAAMGVVSLLATPVLTFTLAAGVSGNRA